MNLPSSLFVTAVIIAVVWFAVAYQPGHEAAYAAAYEQGEAYDADQEPPKVPLVSAVQAEVDQPIQSPSAKAVPKPESRAVDLVSMPALELQGESKRIAVGAVDPLWTKFMGRSDLHSRLNRMRVSAYVYYRNFSEDFAMADVSLGYSSRELVGDGRVSVTTESGDYTELLNPGKYSQAALGKAWETIDYDRAITGVLERHELNSSGVVVNSSVYVLYR